MKNFEKCFNPNSCTESAMPLSSTLCKLLNQAYFGIASSDMAVCRGKYLKMHENFFHSLNDEQKEMFEKLGFVVGETAGIDSREHFNRGLKIGIMLMMEVFQ